MTESGGTDCGTTPSVGDRGWWTASLLCSRFFAAPASCSGLVVRRHVRSDMAQAPKSRNRFFDVTDFFDCTLPDYPLNDDALFSFMRLKDELFSEFSPVASRTTETAFVSG
jgi:hypothetical protein